MRQLRRKGTLGWMAAVFAAALQAQPNVLTWHNDNARTGQNLQETMLSPANVNASTFGKLFTLGVDGKVDAQPLYVPSLTIQGQGLHNVLYVVTEHDSVYAFDADNGALLKQVSLFGVNETPSDARGCGQVTPEIGITATPVIDPGSGPHGTIYVVAMTKDQSSSYHHRLHALDLTTLGEEFNGPVEIAATYPGTGAEKKNQSDTMQTFLPSQHKDRAALLLLNGVVYTSWSSHCDAGPYTSWLIGYNETTLAQTTVLNLIPNGNDGGIWSAGSGPQADAAGNVYLPTGNGTFDTTLSGGFPVKNDYGNAYVKISTNGGKLAVVDYFTMSNTVNESNSDADLGSGGGMLLPPLSDAQGHSRDLAVVAGKDNNIYVMDRANLGTFNPGSDVIYQQLSGALGGGVFSSPAWFNGTLYYGAQGNVMKAFVFANGMFGTNPASQTSRTFTYPGTTPSISANGTSNGIVWAVENSSPAVLHAYDVNNLATELYNSSQASNGRDHFGNGNKFIVPTIVNGKVYVPSNNGTSQQPGSVGVFGLLSTAPAPVSVTPNAGGGSSQKFAFAFSDPNGAADIASMQMDISATLAATGACYFYYSRGANAIYLANDAGAWPAPLAIGVAGTTQNSQCMLDAGASSVTMSGNNLTLNLALSFKAGFAGGKNIYMEVRNATLDSGWSKQGSWTVTASSPSPDFSLGMTPGTQSVGAGGSTAYTVTVTGSNGFSGSVGFGVSGLPSGVTGSFNPTSVTGAGSTTLTINTIAGAPTGGFTAMVTGTSGSLSHNTSASLTITGSSGGPPTAVSVTPNSGSGSSQTFAFAFSDPNGEADIVSMQMDINATLAATGACYFYYSRGANAIYLATDAGAWPAPLTIGVAGTTQNSQCSLDAGASSVLTSGASLTLNLALSFKAGFVGAKNIYMEVQNGTQDSGWVQRGSWTTTAGGTGTPSPPSAVSVTPSSGSGMSRAFTFAYSDLNGAADIVSAQMDVSATLAAKGACYLYYAAGSNAIYLATDAGAWPAPLTVGVAGTTQNSQCSLDAGASSVTKLGNNLTLNLALTFKAGFAGAKNVYMEAHNATLDSGWVLRATWTVP